jgi:hypothetical protein
MNIRIILFVLLVLSGAGCSRKTDLTTILPLQPSNTAFTAKFVKSIPLSCQGEAMIGSVDQLLVSGDRIYVLDKNQAAGLLIFSETGTFLKKISLGRGPGELLNPNSFNIIDNQLVIYDAPGESIFCYYTLDGEFLQKKSMPPGWVIYSFENYSDEDLLIHGMTDPMISPEAKSVKKYHIIAKDLTKCSASYFDISMEMVRFPESRPITCSGGECLLSGRPFDTLYQIVDWKLVPKYLIDFESYKFKPSEISQGTQSVISVFQQGNRKGFIDNIMESRSLVYFTYSEFENGEGAEVPVLYSKSVRATANFPDVLANAGLPEMSLIQFSDDELLCLFIPGNFDETAIAIYQAAGVIPKETRTDSNPVIIRIQITASSEGTKK